MNLKPLVDSIAVLLKVRRLQPALAWESPYSWFSTPGSPKKVVRVERRRRGEPPASGRERAEPPQRRERDEPASSPSYGGPASTGGGSDFGGGGTGGSGTGASGGGGLQNLFPSGGGSGRPLGGKTIIIIVVLLVVCLCIFGGSQLFGGGNIQLPSLDQPAVDQPAVGFEPTEPFAILPLDTPTQRPRPTATRSSVSAPAGSAASAGKSWLVMLYQDADDKILEQDIYIDLNEAERIGSSENLTIVAQVDRYRAGFQGDGDWTSVKRFLVEQDDDLSRVRSQQIADLGELNMADGAALVDFVEWAVANHPADRYALILSDHGMGWPGGWSDASSSGSGGSNSPLAGRLGDNIYLNELDASLAEIRSRTGLDKLDLIGLDACLMSQLEVYSALQPHARVAVASEEVEPALGWAYTSFLEALAQNPSMDAAELSRLIVQSYIEDDQRITDDQARSEMLRQGGGMSGLFGLFGEVTPQTLARQMGQDSTIAAVDLDALPTLVDEFNQFAYSLQNASQPEVARARAYARSYTSIFGSSVPPSYIDLGNFLQLLKQETGDQALAQGSDRLLQALSQVVIAEKHGPKKDGSTGIAIYFPNSDLYRTPEAGARSYTAIADRFAADTLWDDFLAFHYTGRLFQPQTRSAVIPEAGVALRGPGSSQITLSEVTASSSNVAPGQSVLLGTDVSGDNIGYAYLFVGYLDQSGSSIFVADMDYLESSDTREANGVYYPDWEEESAFRLEFEWEPVVFAIDDGQQRLTALIKPQTYGAVWEEATYVVDGVYTYADSGDTRIARLVFSNGVLRQVIGFTGDPQTGAPREIIPNPGDQFTLTERWLDLDQNGQVSQIAEQQGGTLTFGGETFRWVELDAAAGEYVVGFIISDLDGSTTEAYTRLNVR